MYSLNYSGELIGRNPIVKKGNDVSDSLFIYLEFLKEFTNQPLDDVSSTNKKLIWSKINQKIIKLMIFICLNNISVIK